MPADPAMTDEDLHELWRPAAPQAARISQFKYLINEKYNATLTNYEDLYRWSVNHLSSFWDEVWHFTGVRASQPFSKVAIDHSLRRCSL